MRHEKVVKYVLVNFSIYNFFFFSSIKIVNLIVNETNMVVQDVITTGVKSLSELQVYTAGLVVVTINTDILSVDSLVCR